MIRVVPYIDTIGTEKFKKFLRSPFNFDLLNSNNENCLFEGWKRVQKDIYFYEHITISILLTPQYEIEIHGEKYIFPLPKTINDFINDMERVMVDLYWSKTVLLTFEPKDMYSAEGIRQYYVDLLEKMDKGYELL